MSSAQGRERAARVVPILMLLPAILLLVFVFGQPLLRILRMGFNEWEPPRFYVDGFTYAHYERVLSDPIIHEAIRNSALLASIAALIAVSLAYALALTIRMGHGKWRLVMIGLMLCPLLISEISVIFGWWMFLPRNGLLSWGLTQLNVIQEPVSLLYHSGTALLGLVYVVIPFSFFILLSTFQRLDTQQIEASSDLGASAWSTFKEVLLPQTWRGIVLALSQAFIWGMGTYATPRALGPDTLWTVGGLIEDQMTGRFNWPMASALATVMVFLISIALLVGQLSERER